MSSFGQQRGRRFQLRTHNMCILASKWKNVGRAPRAVPHIVQHAKPFTHITWPYEIKQGSALEAWIINLYIIRQPGCFSVPDSCLRMLPSILNSKLTALPKGTLYKSTVSAKFKFPAVSSRFYLYPPRSVFRATCRYDSRDDEDVFRGSKRFRGRNDAYGGSDKTERSGRSRAPFTVNITQKSLSELALPAAGLLAVGLVIGPLLGGLIATALGIGVAVAATTTALAFSWAFLPLLLGGGLLFGGALTAGEQCLVSCCCSYYPV